MFDTKEELEARRIARLQRLLDREDGRQAIANFGNPRLSARICEEMVITGVAYHGPCGRIDQNRGYVNIYLTDLGAEYRRTLKADPSAPLKAR